MNLKGGGILLTVNVLIALLCGQAQAQSTVTTYFVMGGLRSQVIFETWGTDVRVRYRFNIPTALWQIHESPVDFSIDPKLRCRPEHVGHFPLYSGSHMSDIYNVTTGSLVLHSLVLLFEGEPFACGTIVPHSSGFSYSFAFTEFKLGIFGRLYFNQWPTSSYVVGDIQSERSLETGNTSAVSSVHILLHNTILGPYDTMLHGCDGLKNKTILRNLITGANYLPNAAFSRQLDETFDLTSHHGHAISVQTPSGTILGCGRLETVFPVVASYRGKNTLSQLSPYFPATLVDGSLLNILQYNILDGINGTCSNQSAIFDPWSPPGLQVKEGETLHETSDQFPVGDLPHHTLEFLSLLPEVPLIGSATVLGHVVNDSGCNPLVHSVSNEGHIVNGYATFSGLTLFGRITFSQAVNLPGWVLGPTVITVDLSVTDSNQSANGYEWYIQEGFTEVNGTCTDHIGALYNPYGVSTTAESGYFDDCTSLRQQRCAMGDLSGKLGTLGLEPVTASYHKTYSFYDENLHLLGPFTVFGRSLVVYGTGTQSGQPLGCANIEPSLVAEEEISFPKNGTNPDDIDRFEIGHILSKMAGVPLGHVLVSDVRAVNISGSDCLTALLWITGVDAKNTSLNAGNVSALDRQSLGPYSAGPCVPPPTLVVPEKAGLSMLDVAIIMAVCAVVVVIILSVIVILIISFRRKKEVVTLLYKVEGQQEQMEYSANLVKLLPSKKDKWELLGSNFKVGTKLGEGNYGQVYKGTLSLDVSTAPAKSYINRMTQEGKSSYTVAIKLLKGGAEKREAENFLEEIAMMKKVSTGECCHVVQMVGCVSTALPLALALEFVPFGDLLSYLKYWKRKDAVERKRSLTKPMIVLSSAYDRLEPKKVTVEGVCVNATKGPKCKVASAKSQEGKETMGHDDLLWLATAADQETEDQFQSGTVGVTRNQEGKDKEDGEMGYLDKNADSSETLMHLCSATNEEQQFPSSLLVEAEMCEMEVCTTCTSKQITIENFDSLPQSSVLPSLSQPCIPIMELYPDGGEEEGLYVGKTTSKEVLECNEANGGHKGLHSATTKEQEQFYSPLGEPDLRSLPSFAYQISQGMEYLSSLGILHRDLACRNILVDERKLLKISDFGLSRDTPEYVSSLKDKIPLRWMAPETVTDNVCTEKSDVWAFGVCLWEIYTLGDLPYRSIPMPSLVARVVSGYRLPKPERASEEVYQLMLSCWRSEPRARLSFTQLQYSFKSIISAGSNHANYITIEPDVYSADLLSEPIDGNSHMLDEEIPNEMLSANGEPDHHNDTV